MSGAELRLNRLLSIGHNTVIIAIDHGMLNGTVKGIVNLYESAQKINPCIDGILLSPGALKRLPGLFNFKGAPMAIVRLNWSSVFCSQWNYNKAASVPACQVKDAISVGADAVLISLTIQTGSENQDAKNIDLYCRLLNEARQYGIPVIGEYYPVEAAKLTKEELYEQVYAGCRIISELGADLIKTFHTSDFKSITSNTLIPILGLGAEKKDTQFEALQLASDEIRDGARGVVFGRNAMQVKDPFQFQAALCDVVKNEISPTEAIAKYHLED